MAPACAHHCFCSIPSPLLPLRPALHLPTHHQQKALQCGMEARPSEIPEYSKKAPHYMHNGSDLARGPLRSSRNLVTAPAKALFHRGPYLGWLVGCLLSLHVCNCSELGWVRLGLAASSAVKLAPGCSRVSSKADP